MKRGAGPGAHEIVDVDAAAEIGVRNSQREGIGRVVVLDELICWNNLGRNVVFADRGFRPHSVFGETLFPDDDESSQYDLDIHAVLDVPHGGLVLVLNHLGIVRAFRREDLGGLGPPRRVAPTATTSFPADAERAVVAGQCLVGSSPRCDGAQGVLVSAPIRDVLPRVLEVGLANERFGEVTALGTVNGASEPQVALGGVGRVALAPVVGGEMLRPRWEVDVGFRTAVVVSADGLLWAAGCAITGAVDDYDWEGLRGGGFAVLDPDDGRMVAEGPVPEDVAWGTGGVAVVVAGGHLVAVGRTGRLYLLDPRRPGQWRSTLPLAASSLGLAHADAVGRHVLFGFNRGGYRLHLGAGPVRDVDRLAGGEPSGRLDGR